MVTHGLEKSPPQPLNSTHPLRKIIESRRKAKRMTLSAILMVSIMLMTDLNPLVEPEPMPEQWYVIAGEDTNIQDLANRGLGPVAMVDEEGTVFQLAQNLVIDETGRLTIEDCLLWIHDDVQITVNGILIMKNVTIIEDPTDNQSHWNGLVINSTGQLNVEDSAIVGGAPTIRIKDMYGTINQRVSINDLTLMPRGVGIQVEGGDLQLDEPSITHHHSSTVEIGDQVQINYTLNDVTVNDGGAIEWMIDDEPITLSNDTEGNLFLNTTNMSTGFHLLSSRMPDSTNNFQTIASGNSLLLFSDSIDDAGSISTSIVDGKYEFSWNPDDLGSSIVSGEWTSFQPISTFGLTSMQLSLGQSPQGKITFDGKTNLSNIASSTNYGDSKMDQFIMAGGDKIWMGTVPNEGDEFIFNDVGNPIEFQPEVLVGNPYTGVMDEIYLISWSQSDSELRGGNIDTNTVVPQLNLPLNGYSGYATCESLYDEGGNETGPALMRWSLDDASSYTSNHISWDGEEWSQINWTLDDPNNKISRFNPALPSVCMLANKGAQNESLLFLQLQDLTLENATLNGSVLVRLEVDLQGNVLGEDNTSWGDEGVTSALLVRNSTNGIEVARSPYGMMLEGGYGWQSLDSNLSVWDANPQYFLGDDLPRFGGGFNSSIDDSHFVGHLNSDQPFAPLWALQNHDQLTYLSAPAVWDDESSLASCDVNSDGTKELIAIDENGNFGIWVYDELLTPEWIDLYAQGSIQLPDGFDGIQSFACSDTTGESPVTLVVVDGSGSTLFLQQSTAFDYDYANWDYVQSSDGEIHSTNDDIPKHSWFSATARFDGNKLFIPELHFIDSASIVESKLVENDDLDAKIKLNATGFNDTVVKLQVDGQLIESKNWNQTNQDQNGWLNLQAANMSVGWHNIEILVETQTMTLTAYSANSRVISVDGHSDLTNKKTFESINIIAANQSNAIHISNSEIEINSLAIYGSLDNNVEPSLIVSNESNLTVLGLNVQDHNGPVVETNGGILAISNSNIKNISGTMFSLSSTSSRINSANLTNDQSFRTNRLSYAREPLFEVLNGDLSIENTTVNRAHQIINSDNAELNFDRVDLWDNQILGSITGGGDGNNLTIRDLVHYTEQNSVGSYSDLWLDASQLEILVNGLVVSDSTRNVSSIKFDSVSGTMNQISITSSSNALNVIGNGLLQVEDSNLIGGNSTYTLEARNSMKVQLTNTSISGKQPAVKDDAKIEVISRPSFSFWDHNLLYSSSFEVTVRSMEVESNGSRTIVAQGVHEVSTRANNTAQMPKWAGEWPFADQNGGISVPLWTLSGDGTSDWIENTIQRASMYSLEWSWAGEEHQLMVPLATNHPINVHVGGDSDIDGLSNSAENQDGSKAIHLSTGNPLHDLSAVDGFSYGFDSNGSLILPPPTVAGNYDLWVRWFWLPNENTVNSSSYSDSISSSDCVYLSLNSQNTLCTPVSTSPRWYPAQSIDLTQTINITQINMELNLSSNLLGNGTLVLDEAWLIPVGELPSASWIPDIEMDGIVDGLELPFSWKEGKILHPYTSDSIQDSRQPFGWSLDLQSIQNDTYIGPFTSSGDAWVYLINEVDDSQPQLQAAVCSTTDPMDCGMMNDVLIKNDGWSSLEVFDLGSNQYVTLSINPGEYLRIIGLPPQDSTRSLLGAVWSKSSWSSNSQLIWEGDGQDLKIDEISNLGPESRLRIQSQVPSIEPSFVSPSSLLAIDDVTHNTVVLERLGDNCTITIYIDQITFAADPLSSTKSRIVSCSSIEKPELGDLLTLDVEDGWIAAVFSNKSNSGLDLMIIPFDDQVNNETVWLNVVSATPQPPSTEALEAKVQFANGRILLHTDSTDSWFLVERNESIWQWDEFALKQGALDPVSLASSVNSVDGMKMCITGDFVFFSTFDSITGRSDVYTGWVGDSSIISPFEATNLLLPNTSISDYNRVSQLYTYLGQSQSVNVDCSSTFVIAQATNLTTIFDTLSGENITVSPSNWTSVYIADIGEGLLIDRGDKWWHSEIRDEDGTLRIDEGMLRDLGDVFSEAGIPHLSRIGFFSPLNSSGYNLIHTNVDITVAEMGQESWSIQGAWIDEYIRLPDLDKVILSGSDVYHIRLESVNMLNIELVADEVVSIPILADTDLDGLLDGEEKFSHSSVNQIVEISDATTHLSCVDAEDALSLSARWDGEARLDDQCRLVDGTALVWKPGEGAGARLEMPLQAESIGKHRLSLSSSSVASMRSEVVYLNGDSPIPINVPIRIPVAVSPQFAENLTKSWARDLLSVQVFDSNGRKVAVLDDQIRLSDPLIGLHRDGKYILEVNLQGYLDVDIENVGGLVFSIGWASDATGDVLPTFPEYTMGDGPTSIFDFEYLSTNPLSKISFGIVGASDPLSPDSDSDGILDGFDHSILKIDVDNDGLTDLQEAIIGTNPLSRDTDGDAIFDGIEVGLFSGNSANCISDAQTFSPGSTAGIANCGGDIVLDGSASWIHRRFRDSLLNFSTISRLDANTSSSTDPLLIDSDNDGLPDGWVDGWNYVGQIADTGGIVTDGTAVESIIEMSTLGAYDETRWVRGKDRDGLIAVEEGEDLNLDGHTTTSLSSECGNWNLTKDWHIPCDSSFEIDPTQSDTDGDLIPDGYELLASIWFTDNDIAGGALLQNPVVKDAYSDNDTMPPEYMDWDIATTSVDIESLDSSDLETVTIVLPLTTSEELLSTNCVGGSFNTFQFQGNLPRFSSVSLVSSEILGQQTLKSVKDGRVIPADFDDPTDLSSRLNEVRMDRSVSVCDLSDMVAIIIMPQFHDNVKLMLNGVPEFDIDQYSSTNGIPAVLINDKALVIRPAIMSGPVGDNVTALAEYLAGTLPTRADTDAGIGADRIDMLTDGFELAPGHNIIENIVPSDIPIRWFTTAIKGRLGLRWFAPQAQDSLFALPNSSGGDDWYSFALNGKVSQELNGTACGAPDQVDPFARLDDGAWMGLSKDRMTICVYHAHIHYDDPLTWDHNYGWGWMYVRDDNATLPDWWSNTTNMWNLDAIMSNSGYTAHHQFGFMGAPHHRDADRDGLLDGWEGDSAWTQTGSEWVNWQSKTHLNSTGANPWDPIADDHDGDGVADGWDPDADGDGLIDGMEPGWMIDLDGDGLPGAIDPDSDGDNMPDGLEHLWDKDSDNDGFRIWLTGPGGVQIEVRVGINALDADSDNDGLVDGWVDGFAWNPLSSITVPSTIPFDSANQPLEELTKAIWFADTNSDRLLGGPTTLIEINGAETYSGTFSSTGLSRYDESPDIMQPWEGEVEDITSSFNISNNDTDPSRRDTDGDGLLDGTAIFSHENNGFLVIDLGFDAPVIAGESIGPFAHAEWIPPLPWNEFDEDFDSTTTSTSQITDCSAMISDTTRPAWEAGFTGQFAPIGAAPEFISSTCWDMRVSIDSANIASENWTGWSNPLLADSDGDGIDDVVERTTWTVTPIIPDWYDWTSSSKISSQFHYQTAGDPLNNDTDGDGILDGDEKRAGMGLDNPDSDLDGIPDAVEDADLDGIVDSTETNPMMIDTDGDGLPDGSYFTWDDHPFTEQVPESLSRIDPERQLFAENIGTEFPVASFDQIGELNPDGTLRLSDPLNPDSDGDTIRDGNEYLVYSYFTTSFSKQELENMLNLIDYDEDGIDDSFEIPIWARGDMGDSDKNWWNDKVMNPMSIDGDSDGLHDSLEPLPVFDSDDDDLINSIDKCSANDQNTACTDDGEVSEIMIHQTSSGWISRNATCDVDGCEIGSEKLYQSTSTTASSLPESTMPMYFKALTIPNQDEDPSMEVTVRMQNGFEATVMINPTTDEIYFPTELFWIVISVGSEVITNAPSITSQMDSTNTVLDIRGVINSDRDFDGIENSIEGSFDTDSLDRDTDDDGVIDGLEYALCESYKAKYSLTECDLDSDGDNPGNDIDSDGDGILDGIELGITEPVAAIKGSSIYETTELSSLTIFDADPSTTTDPMDLDTDDDGVPDGWNDINDNQVLEESEIELHYRDGTSWARWTSGNSDDLTLTEMTWGFEDRDGDGLQDQDEINPLDPDMDDDGLPDGPSLIWRQALARQGTPLNMNCLGESWNHRSHTPPVYVQGMSTQWAGYDWDGDSIINVLDSDSDGDGLKDGLECGVTTFIIQELGWESVDDSLVNTSSRSFVSDSDWSTISDPFDADSDEDGLSDGREDSNSNGLQDDWETDNLNADSDGDDIHDGIESGVFELTGVLSRDSLIFEYDADEGRYTTDPLKMDSDSDGIDDDVEDCNKNGMYDIDSTKDCTIYEKELNASSPDTDGDLVLDLQEINGWEVIIYNSMMSNPNQNEANAGMVIESSTFVVSVPWMKDSDGDGLEDGYEFRAGSNPQLSDTDGDGLLDKWEYDEGGDLNTPEDVAPRVDATKQGSGFSISYECSGGDKFCLDPEIVRKFSLRIEFSDNSGLGTSNVWLSDSLEDGEQMPSPPNNAYDLIGLTILRNSLSSGTISDPDGLNTWDSSNDVSYSHSGMVDSVSWIGDLEKSQTFKLNSLSTAWDILGGDLFDFFDGYAVHINAADINGNTGQGTVEFPSAGDIIMEWISSAVDGINDLIDSFMSWVLEQAKKLLDNVIMPLIDFYLSAAIALYPYIEYFVVILESIAYIDLDTFWNHEYTQVMFGALLSFLESWNLISNTFNLDSILEWIIDVCSQVKDLILDAIPSEPEQIMQLFNFQIVIEDFEDSSVLTAIMMPLLIFRSFIAFSIITPTIISIIIQTALSGVDIVLSDTINEIGLTVNSQGESSEQESLGRSQEASTPDNLFTYLIGPIGTGYLFGKLLGKNDGNSNTDDQIASIINIMITIFTLLSCAAAECYLAFPFTAILLAMAGYSEIEGVNYVLASFTGSAWIALTENILEEKNENMEGMPGFIGFVMGLLLICFGVGYLIPNDLGGPASDDMVEMILSIISIILSIISLYLLLKGKSVFAQLLSTVSSFILATSISKMYYDNDGESFSDDSKLAKQFTAGAFVFEVITVGLWLY